MRKLPSGTVTFVFTDVEGSTKLLHEHGDRYADVLAEHRRLLRDAFGRHGGVEVDTQGDAFFYAFPRASNALAAARAGQAALAGTPVRVRMGLHTGEPLVTDEGYVGVDVHKGARVAAAGHGGQVLVSQATRDLVGGDGLRDLGEHRLKDLTAPERIFQLGAGDFPPLSTLYQTNLPIPATPFLGRERELSEVGALLAREDVRLVTLTGAGGSGKTRLALQAAGAAAGEYPHGVWWVPLAPLTDAGAVLETAARVLGVAAPLPEVVRDRRLFLLLDNFEHVVAAAPELSALLAACPNLDLLVTSRERLQLAGEHLYAVLGLERADSRDLFSARARAIRADFAPDGALDELCARLDDLPLALELAAARTALLSTEQLLGRLGARLDLLRGGRDADTRQQTLRATIQWSYDLLETEEQRLLARLSVFRGGCTLEAAETVCDAHLDLLQSLVDKSLVRLRGGGRFWMLETIREFAEERLGASGEAKDLRRRHAEFFLRLAEASFDRGGEVTQTGAVEPGRAEYDNFRAALGWSAVETPALGLRLAAALEGYWVVTSPFEGIRWLGLFLERVPDAPLELRARALRAIGGSANPAGDDELAERMYQQSLEALRELGDEAGAARLILRLGYAAFYRSDMPRARALGEESIALFRAYDDSNGEALALGLLGELEYAEGRHASGLELMERSAALAAETDFVWWRAGMLGKLADCMRDQGSPEQAEALAREAIALSRDLGDRLRMVRGLARLAVLAAERGEAVCAGRLWGAVEAEEARGPVGAWERERVRFETPVLAAGGPALEEGRAEGRRLSLEDAVEVALDGA